MAVQEEQDIMNEIGLGASYHYFNGSGSCEFIANRAVDRLEDAMEEHGLSLSPKWKHHCMEALRVDKFDGGRYSLTNTWVACSYAIQDGLYRRDGDGGFDPAERWHFFHPEKRELWEQLERERVYFDEYKTARDWRM